ncbi:MAG: YHYH protein [Paraglaciecola sp.]|uniref:PKD domain-containing protein n=1 Tax=Paraglaciecola sp. TaxID=1920173 RepID=UPI00329714F6
MTLSVSNLSKFAGALTLCLALAACGSSSSSDDNDDTTVTNTAPTVNAGVDQTVDAGDTVSLSVAVTDDDSDYSIAWSQTSGTSTVSLDDLSSATVTFTAPSTDTEQTLVFEVSVDDGTNDPVTDSVSITVNAVETDAVISVSAGADQTVESGDTVTLTATVLNSDTEYTLSWSQTSGDSTLSLSDSSAASVSFTAPTVTDDEVFTFTVSVDDGVNDIASDSVSITVTTELSTSDESVWIINETDEVSNHILDSTTGIGVLVDVQSVATETVNNKEYTVVNSQGIPKYDTTITQDIVDAINNRPKASTDLVTGETTASVGDIIQFGEDVGYISNSNCTTNAGYGAWPPGPDCPTESERTVYLPVEPTPTTEVCENGLSKVGLFVNGSSIYNWGDGMSYNSEGAWQNLAPVAEFYDIDICGGHAANGDYHAHQYTSCLADLVGDNGDQHSPIYGFAADGYPIYGPWESDGVLAVSAWVVRDYSADSATGCDDGERSCALVDQYDISLGTEEVSSGPAFDESVTTLSSNTLTAFNGYYFEDHYWDETLTAQGGVYLDQYNAHYDETRGYHYHITIVEDGDSYKAAFPYIIGTRFAGELEDNAVASCSTDNGSNMGPPP